MAECEMLNRASVNCTIVNCGVAECEMLNRATLNCTKVLKDQYKPLPATDPCKISFAPVFFVVD